jgi:hypothetical protein
MKIVLWRMAHDCLPISYNGVIDQPWTIVYFVADRRVLNTSSYSALLLECGIQLKNTTMPGSIGNLL